MYVANSSRTLFATVGLLVVSLSAAAVFAEAPESSAEVASTRDAIETQLARPLDLIELVKFEVDSPKVQTGSLPVQSPVVTLVPTKSSRAAAIAPGKSSQTNAKIGKSDSSQQALVRYVAADLKPKQSRHLPVRSVSSSRTAATRGGAAALKAMVRRPARKLVAAPAKLPVNKKQIDIGATAKSAPLVIPESSLDIPSPPVSGSLPVVSVVESLNKNGGGIAVKTNPVQAAVAHPVAKLQKPLPLPQVSDAASTKSIVETAKKVSPADPVGRNVQSPSIGLSSQHINALTVPTVNPAIPSIPANSTFVPQAAPAPFIPQAVGELGALTSQPTLEPVPFGQHQTLPVGGAYVPDVPNAWVPESSVTGSFLDTASSTLGSGYQAPSLFSHSWESASCNDEGWPCSTCGQNTCCCCEVRWRARADALFLHRSRADGFDIPLVRKFGDGDRPTIDCPPDAISMDFHGGPRFSLIRDNLCDGCDFEATYYFISQWTGNDFVNGEVAVVGFDSIGFGRADVRYESRFQNAEANLFRDLNNWTQWMVGFRWLQFDEHASVTASTDLVPNFDQRVDTLNNLFGGQFGLRRRIWDRGGFTQVYATAKGGIFNNNIDRRTFGFGTSPLSDNVASFVGELDFLANIEVTPCWSLQVGYQVLWVTGVAEALDQFFSPDQIFDDGAPILHGFRFGVTRTF